MLSDKTHASIYNPKNLGTNYFSINRYPYGNSLDGKRNGLYFFALFPDKFYITEIFIKNDSMSFFKAT